MSDLPLHVISETNTTITLGWVSPAGCRGYIFDANGKRSSTLDPARSSVKFAKPGPYHVEALGTLATGDYPPPTPVGPKLIWSPPGLTVGADPTNPNSFPGYTVIDLPPMGTIRDCGGKNVWVRPAAFTATEHGVKDARTPWGFSNYANLVAVGSTFNVLNDANEGDFAMQLAGGTPSSVAYFEGWDIRTVNAWTIRNAGTLIVQNCRAQVSTYPHNASADHSSTHPDVIQIWNDESGANGHPKVKIHRLSAFSDMTFWSQLENYVASWEAHQCNLKGLPDSQDTRVGGDMMYPWGYDHAACKFTLSEIYWEPTGPYRNLDNHVGYDSGGNTCTIHDASGQHPDYKKVPGSPDCPWATEQGDTITFTKTGEGLFGQTVIAGPPPAGDFVPAGSVGLGYTSPGYQP